MNKCPCSAIATILAAVGAINWALVALFQFNLITALAGDMTRAAKIIYLLVGVSGVLVLLSLLPGVSCLCSKAKDGDNPPQSCCK